MNAFKDVLGFAGKAADVVLLGGAVGKSNRRNQFADFLEQGQYDEAAQFAAKHGEGGYAQLAQQRGAQATEQQNATRQRQMEEFQFLQNTASFLDTLPPEAQKSYLDLHGRYLIDNELLGDDDLQQAYAAVGVPNGFTGLARSAIDPNQQQQNVFEGQKIAETARSNVATEAISRENTNLRRQELERPAAGADYEPETVDLFAHEYLKYGPTVLTKLSGYKDRTQVANITAQRVNGILDSAGMTQNDLARIRSDVASYAGNVKKLQQNLSAIRAFEGLADANADRLLELLDNIPDAGIPVVNAIARAGAQGLGGVDQAEFTSVLATFRTEAAGILGRLNPGTGQTTDSLRHEVASITPSNATKEQLTRIINRLKTEFSIRESLIADELSASREALATTGVTGPEQQGFTDDDERRLQELERKLGAQ